ncbi:hypothetical protein J4E85_005659 [Alternaria conjuncta]|uniref:uncharacterized protein n=1 Tax=Alternaria conjuncta TaxID=181017 RepID=UPI002220C777|nr:uncharacterized protein J4E85_005659 [Alternaria conjuncta]KAI4929035.1 hypothetical protein J4E85_005659 [Alternaria conjuncta]
MRFSGHYLVLCLALVLCLQFAVAAPHAAVRRQDDTPSAESTREPQDSASRQPSATPTPSGIISSSIESERPSSTEASSVKPSETPAPSSINDVPTTTPSDDATPAESSESASADPKNPLPIHPKLTPAMGVTGVLLLLSGLGYAIIGIKNKWVYVFGSAAYLTALAVTVLIVYLMNPPVSDAIQGAFFVAAFFTGVIFGVLSLVFADIAEGFGCLLGGFCLSMWFLSVKDGGLITSGTGRAIFIGCMSAGGYSLAFSHYTRNYGLIASIAFSGATAAILGIDCLAGSGWKEFWLYLWNLNDDIFPLNTNTYPVTKNIKAELAGVVIITVVSIVSQLRVWKLVKEHRAKTAAQQLERQADQDREEEEQGRKVEEVFQKERAQWEAAYGNGQNVPEESVRSSTSDPKDLTHVHEKEVSPNDSAVTVNMSTGMMRSASRTDKPDATVTVAVLDDDAIQQIEPEAHTAENEKALPEAPKDDSRPTLVKSNSLRPTAPPPPPAVVPLPFKVPTEDEAHTDDDNTSVSAVPETDHDAEVPRRVSKRVSDVSAMRQRISRDMVASQEALNGMRGDEDDRASSIAATLDDDLDVLSVRNLSPVESPIGTEHDNPFEKPGLKRQDSDTVPNRKSVVNTADVVKSLTTSTDPKTADSPKEQTFKHRADTVMSSSKASSEKYSKSTKSDEISQGSQMEQGGSQVGSLTENVMPEKLSKIALSYRTNEWAKHLEAAEKPDYEDMFLPSSPGIMLADGSEEKPTPVSDELLYESKRESRRMSTGSRTQRNSSQGLRRNTSTFSQESLVNQRSLTHSPSIASPQVLSRSNSAIRLDTLSPLPSNTLLSKRESLIKNRASALTLTPQMSSPNLSQRGADDEDMTLSQRRQLLQAQQLSPSLSHQPSLRSPGRTPPSSSQKWQNKAWATKGAPAGFDSHQPKRSSSAQSEQKREQLYAGWRDTMRDIAPPQQTAANVVEQQRAALLMERRQKEMERQQREVMQQQRASQMDSMMRSGQMMDAHREAMRKMQANANRHT